MIITEFSQKLLNPEQPLRVHLIGVAGSGMSGLARLLIQMGHHVSGSDRVTSGETERLRAVGLDFSSPHSAEVVKDADAVIYSSAIRESNLALAAALEHGIATFRRAECLAAILHTKDGVIVSGTHGKTTTSSMMTLWRPLWGCTSTSWACRAVRTGSTYTTRSKDKDRGGAVKKKEVLIILEATGSSLWHERGISFISLSLGMASVKCMLILSRAQVPCRFRGTLSCLCLSGRLFL